MVKNPRQILVTVAQTQIGVHETSRNAGPELVKYWDATSYPDGDEDRQPWCAAFMAWVIYEAIKRTAGEVLSTGDKTRPRSAGVKDWVPWALKPSNGCVVFGPSDPKYQPEPGDIVIYTFSHIGLVESFDGWTKGLRTIEGNTDDEGSREGVKVCRRLRKRSEIQTFIRLAAKATRAGKPSERIR